MLVQMAEATAQHVAGLAADNKCTGIHLHGKLSHLVKLGFTDHTEDNIFLGMQREHPEAFDKMAETILVDMMSHCSRVFEKLPILQGAPILRNILYSGVWCRYTVIVEQRKKKRQPAAKDGGQP